LPLESWYKIESRSSHDEEGSGSIGVGHPKAAIDLNLELAADVPSLQARVTDLEPMMALLTKGSSNPPNSLSSNEAAAKPSARFPEKSKKHKRGGQPGHRGQNRDLIPVDEKESAMRAGSPDAVTFSRWILLEVGRMFGLFHESRSGHLDRKTLVLKSVPLRVQIGNCPQTYELSPDPAPDSPGQAVFYALLAARETKIYDHPFTINSTETKRPIIQSPDTGQ
jgi:hypothetical protein